MLPIWLAPDGGGAGKPVPGREGWEAGPREGPPWEYPVREGSSPSWCQKSHAAFIALHVWLGVCVVGGRSYQGELEMFSFFFKKSISIHPIPGKTTIPPAVSKSFSFEKYPSSPLLLASVGLFQAAVNYSVNGVRDLGFH